MDSLGTVQGALLGHHLGVCRLLSCASQLLWQWDPVSLLICLFFLFHGARDGNQDLEYTRQTFQW